MRSILIALSFVLTACTTAEHISDASDTWVIYKSHILWIPVSMRVMHCRAAKVSDDKAKPICFEARVYDPMQDPELFKSWKQ